MSGQLHTPAALPPGKQYPVPIGYEAGWAPESILTTRTENSQPCRDQTEKVSPPHLRTETHSVSETSCFLLSGILDDKSEKSVIPSVRARAHQGDWQPQRNRNATAISENCQTELNTCYWMEQCKLRKRQRNSRKGWETQLSGNGACQSSHNYVAVWFPVSCSITRISD
jgi:hypothetical protein